MTVRSPRSKWYPHSGTRGAGLAHSGGAGLTHSGRRRRCWYWIVVVVVVCAGSRIVEAVVDRDVDAEAIER